jgi:hypothetical protein
MNPLAAAIDEALAFVRAHPKVMTRAEVDQFKELAERVYLLTPDKWLLRLPQVTELWSECESQDLNRKPVQFIGKLNLPGDWDVSATEGELPSSYKLTGKVVWPDGTPFLVQDEPPPVPAPVFFVCATPRWFADMEILRRLAEQVEYSEAITQPANPPLSLPPRLTVDLVKKTITLDGVGYDVSSTQALRWIKVLADHPGEWISRPQLKDYDPDLDGCRTDHLKEYLPDAILNLIDSKTGAGSRIRL